MFSINLIMLKNCYRQNCKKNKVKPEHKIIQTSLIFNFIPFQDNFNLLKFEYTILSIIHKTTLEVDRFFVTLSKILLSKIFST